MNINGLQFPDELLYAPDHNLWLREEADASVTLGLTAYGCALYGQIFAFTPKRDQLHIDCERSFGVVEFAKAASSARSPLAGVIVASNQAVVRNPALINQACYTSGWLIRIQPDDWVSTKARLVSGPVAAKAFAERMRLDDYNPHDNGVQALRNNPH